MGLHTAFSGAHKVALRMPCSHHLPLAGCRFTRWRKESLVVERIEITTSISTLHPKITQKIHKATIFVQYI
jgi:hypothetical protein